MSGFDMSAMKAEYAERLPERLREIALAVGAARADRAGLARAILLAHRLSGTAGSYGFTVVGDAAGRLEAALERVLAEGDRAAGWSAVEAALGHAEQIAREAIADFEAQAR